MRFAFPALPAEQPGVWAARYPQQEMNFYERYFSSPLRRHLRRPQDSSRSCSLRKPLAPRAASLFIALCLCPVAAPGQSSSPVPGSPASATSSIQAAQPAASASPGAQSNDDNKTPTFIIKDVPTGRPLRIIVYGDMRFTNPSNTSDTAPGVRKWLAQKVAAEKPDLLLLTGDMPFHGSDPADWKVYEQETAAWKKENLRVFPTIGNHEVITNRSSGMQNYFNAYPQVDGRGWYSFQFANVYVIVLDTSNFLGPGWPQRDWLDYQLAHLPGSADFVFFLFHVPIIADLQTAFILNIPGGGSLELRHAIEQRAASSHAKFVIFNGHIHNYERFEVKGITHVITGGGGARPYPVFVRGSQDLFHANTYPNFNYVVITLEGKHAEAKMYRVFNPYGDPSKMYTKVLDSFTLDAR